MFDEFSMISPGPLAEYVGFTEAESETALRKVSDGSGRSQKIGTTDILSNKCRLFTARDLS